MPRVQPLPTWYIAVVVRGTPRCAPGRHGAAYSRHLQRSLACGLHWRATTNIPQSYSCAGTATRGILTSPSGWRAAILDDNRTGLQPLSPALFISPRNNLFLVRKTNTFRHLSCDTSNTSPPVYTFHAETGAKTRGRAYQQALRTRILLHFRCLRFKHASRCARGLPIPRTPAADATLPAACTRRTRHLHAPRRTRRLRTAFTGSIRILPYAQRSHAHHCARCFLRQWTSSTALLPRLRRKATRGSTALHPYPSNAQNTTPFCLAAR